MKPITTSNRSAATYRRFGRKALQAERLAKAMNAPSPAARRRSFTMPSGSPKILAIGIAVFIGASALLAGGLHMHLSRVAAAEKAEAAAELTKLRARSAEADTCRRQKAEQKAELIGKITFDELYDHGECDK